jgi:hypothetical protein
VTGWILDLTIEENIPPEVVRAGRLKIGDRAIRYIPQDRLLHPSERLPFTVQKYIKYPEERLRIVFDDGFDAQMFLESQVIAVVDRDSILTEEIDS